MRTAQLQKADITDLWTIATDFSMTGREGRYGRCAKAWDWHSISLKNCMTCVGAVQQWGRRKIKVTKKTLKF